MEVVYRVHLAVEAPLVLKLWTGGRLWLTGRAQGWVRRNGGFRRLKPRAGATQTSFALTCRFSGRRGLRGAGIVTPTSSVDIGSRISQAFTLSENPENGHCSGARLAPLRKTKRTADRERSRL
jgi:hypothetical protein